jgi:adenine/guanine phosphoribosyltransferase-like PRPP-binding protein
MAAYVDEWVKTFDIQYDLIIGIPRSGLLVGCMIATKLAKPLATPDDSL